MKINENFSLHSSTNAYCPAPIGRNTLNIQRESWGEFSVILLLQNPLQSLVGSDCCNNKKQIKKFVFDEF